MDAYFTPWHRESFRRFLHEGLPQLLAERLPLAGYHAEETGERACRVTLAVHDGRRTVETCFAGVPCPDADGCFDLDGVPTVVLPGTDNSDLERAEIHCVGEQLLAFFAERLGEAPAHLEWDEGLLRSWAAVEAWTRDFLLHHGQRLQQTNWLAARAHLRRLRNESGVRTYGPGHWGRVCPFETPEGPHVGRILSLAVGAVIRDGRLVRVDERPAAALGLTASMVPFSEHNDLNRQLMGVNMMRQWLTPAEVEPALVQTGSEPETADFWCGRNLLTAFVFWGGETFEDGCVVSESAARRLGDPLPLQVGDKLSNRHGIKTVVNRVLPDAEMPHLPDGTPVELAWSFTGLPTRLGLVGALREAVAGRLARAGAGVFLAPPFAAPGEAELRARLKAAGLREDGMEPLTRGQGGAVLPFASTVGWIYWGRTHHLAAGKLEVHAEELSTAVRGEPQGESEYETFRQAGAWNLIRDQFHLQAVSSFGEAARAAALRQRPAPLPPAPSPAFAELAFRLALGGIRAELADGRLRFRFAAPEGECLKLAREMPHPWLASRPLREIGVGADMPEYGPVATLNARLAHLLETRAPASLAARTGAELERAVHALFEALLPGWYVRFHTQVLYSGTAVVSVGADLRLDQLGIPDDLAWPLFGPEVALRLGNPEAVTQRTESAAAALDELLAERWVLLSVRPMPGQATSCLAFRPVRHPEPVLRLHPLVCGPLNADCDGDQASVFIPLSEAGQREAGERLTVAACVERDPAFLDTLQAMHAGTWGLAHLSRTPEGLARISEAAGVEVPAPAGWVTKETLAAALQRVRAEQGTAAALAALERLMRLGVDVASSSGASIGPFVGSTLPEIPAPPSDDPDAWERHIEERDAALAARANLEEDELGPALLLWKSGARSSLRHLRMITGPWLAAEGEQAVLLRHGYRDGLTAEERRSIVKGHWDGLIRTVREWQRYEQGPTAASLRGLHVLARAAAWKRPGIVFATAAATGETDPLTDPDSRLFVGLEVR